MSALGVVYLITAILAGLAAVLALVRVGRGPTLLDRAIASDVITACGIGLVAVMVVWWSRDDLAAVILLLAVAGFLSPVVIARFASRERADERRILTAQEAADQLRRREEEARQAELAELDEAEQGDAHD